MCVYSLHIYYIFICLVHIAEGPDEEAESVSGPVCPALGWYWGRRGLGQSSVLQVCSDLLCSQDTEQRISPQRLSALAHDMPACSVPMASPLQSFVGMKHTLTHTQLLSQALIISFRRLPVVSGLRLSVMKMNQIRMKQ